MKAMQIPLVLGLAVLGIVGTGCTEKYAITVTNACDKIQNVTIADSDGFPVVDGLSVEPNGGRGDCTIKQDADASLGYVIKTSQFSKEFVINKNSAKPMYFLITPNGITGPFDKNTKVSQDWDNSKTERINRDMKVE